MQALGVKAAYERLPAAEKVPFVDEALMELAAFIAFLRDRTQSLGLDERGENCDMDAARAAWEALGDEGWTFDRGSPLELNRPAST